MRKIFFYILFVFCFISIALLCYALTNQNTLVNTKESNDIKYSLAQVKKDKINQKDPCSVFSQDILNLAKEDPYFFFIVDKTHFLPAEYKPKDLVKDDYIFARKDAHDAFNKMKEAAKKDDIKIWITSGFRPYERQKYLYELSVKAKGQEHADKYLAKPGASQHQLGTAVDINSVENSFANTPECKWLEANAEKFGFSLSFPKGQEEKTGYAFEPWHYRYITTEGTALQKKYFNDSQVDFLDALNACLK